MRLFPIGGGGTPTRMTLDYETRRALIVSDNEGANRLLSFAGHKDPIHEHVWGHGARSVRVRGGLPRGGQRAVGDGVAALRCAARRGAHLLLPERKAARAVPPTELPGARRGRGPHRERKARRRGHVLRGQERRVDPAICRTPGRLVRPDLSPDAEPTMAPEDAEAVRTFLRTLPSESGLPASIAIPWPTGASARYLRGLERVRPRAGFELYSKIGQAYGFTMDNAYVVDKRSGKAFFLTACVYSNANEVLNDDVYGYDSEAMPLLADLAEAFARKAFGE